MAYVVGVAPNFYGFLGNMGVAAPTGVTKAYYFAYEIGLVASFATYWACCWVSPPALTVPLSEWKEPKDYIRPEERGPGDGSVIEGDVESVSVGESGEGAEKKDMGEGLRDVRSVD